MILDPHRQSDAGSSRQIILDRLRGHRVPDVDLPTINPGKLIRYDDPLEQFQTVLRSVGGQSHLVDSPDQIAAILGEIPVFADATAIASTVPDAVTSTVDASTIADPHGLSHLDWSIIGGEFCVAENGAIWVDGKTLPHRVMIFIAQYLAIVVSRSAMVTHMHEAYERIPPPNQGFGIFVSGPSKTADIEQSLVIGAHGCRNLQVFLLP